MHRSRFLCAVFATGLTLAGSACSNLTSPAGEDPDSLSPVADRGASAPNQPRMLPNAEDDSCDDDTDMAFIRRILISYEGAEGAKPDLKRDQVEARKLAAEIAGKLQLPNADFAALAKEHSDAPDAARGGMMPPFERDANMDPRIKSAAFQLKAGTTSGILNTAQGFTIIQRVK